MRRVLAGAGRVLITLGLLILIFVAYQLWGTNILQARAQSQLEDDYAQLQTVLGDEPADPSGATTTVTEATTTTGPPTTVEDDPTFELGGAQEVDLSALPWRLGDPLGTIKIPHAGVDQFFVVGVGREELNKGPGLYPGTPLPGSPGVSAIAGHRTTHGAPFYDLNELRVKGDPESDNPNGRGDLIVTETPAGTHAFEVIATRIVQPDETWVAAPIDQPIDPGVAQARHNWSEVFSAQHQLWNPQLSAEELPTLDPEGAYLVLTTCNPRYSAAERLVVFAELLVPQEEQVDEAALGAVNLRPEDLDRAVEVQLGGEGGTFAELPGFEGTESIAEGLGGDPSSLPPAILWALATTAVGMAWWWCYRRWRHPGTWFAGVAPFLAVLFGFYVYLERLLPSGF